MEKSWIFPTLLLSLHKSQHHMQMSWIKYRSRKEFVIWAILVVGWGMVYIYEVNIFFSYNYIDLSTFISSTSVLSANGLLICFCTFGCWNQLFNLWYSSYGTRWIRCLQCIWCSTYHLQYINIKIHMFFVCQSLYFWRSSTFDF
jgi:hypothetical protein